MRNRLHKAGTAFFKSDMRNRLHNLKLL